MRIERRWVSKREKMVFLSFVGDKERGDLWVDLLKMTRYGFSGFDEDEERKDGLVH